MKKVLFIFLLSGLVYACKKKDVPKKDDPTATAFNKQALLVNMADNVIIPNYKNFETSLQSLITAFDNFKNSNTVADYEIVREKFHATYKFYQLISPCEFGPAEQVVVRTNFNVFPCDTSKIKSNINAGNYNLDAANNLAAKGLAALDFLFYGYATNDSKLVADFKNDNKRVKYVEDVLNDMHLKIKTVNQTWTNTYRNTFVNALSTDIGSSIGFLVNQINFELDYLKNAKVGIPLGKKTLGIAMPDNCESFYGAFSVEYALETLTAIENLYLGRSTEGTNGLGFDDYLDHLKIKHGDKTLNKAINDQFAIARNKLTLVQNPLSEQVTKNSAVVDAAYVELVKLLVLLKTDMPSNLGVVISYQDGDGD